MADTTTIGNLPQITLDELTNDTLVPVENVDGTKAANLMQLRKKLNSVYVELVDADLNALKEDGIYECWGTTLNAPTTEAVTWIVQTATHESLTVQDAFGLGENSYHYFYRRRWNGVSWTAWENKIQTLETVKTNVDLSNLSAAGQAKFDAKANTDLGNLSTAGNAILNGKADINASNFTATGKQNIVGWGMPDYSTGVSFNFVNGGTFTAPYDCYVKVVCYGSGNSFGAKIYNTGIYLARITPLSSQFLSDGFVLSKGDWFAMEGTEVSQLVYFKLKGVK